MASIASYSWSTRRAANDGFVLETKLVDGYIDASREYGPMPPHIVPAFVRARRIYIAELMKEEGNDYVIAQ